ncbi:MAG: hypothetical protein JHC33_07015 [Ignisphaera sp.]|nr:hypothetical protein [Ignisphaera sp.]
MLERKDISGFLLMRDSDGIINLQIIADGSDNMSVVSVDAFNVNIADILDSLMPALDVENSIADSSIAIINAADAEDTEEISE